MSATFRETLVPGPGVQAIPHLAAFLPECDDLRLSASPTARTDSVVGWGHKPTARYARELAARKGLPYLAVEDGFLRSIGLGEAGAPPLSLVVDDLGVYYDAAQPSRLETLLQDGGWETPELMARARAAMDRIVALGFPVLLGASRKRFIGALDGDAPADARLGGSIAAALAGAAAGVAAVRVHDVRETVQALSVWTAIAQA